MCYISPMLKKILLLGCSCFVLTVSFAHAQTASHHQSPPVNITIAVPDNLKVEQEIPVTIKVTPQSDIQADISCLLPKGVKLIHQQRVHARPYHQKGMPNMERQKQYRFSTILWIGPLKANETKEFTLQVKIADKGSYKVICLFDAPPKFGEKEGDYTIRIN